MDKLKVPPGGSVAWGLRFPGSPSDSRPAACPRPYWNTQASPANQGEAVLKKGSKFRRVPGYAVFREVLRRVDLKALATTLTGWMQSHAGELPRNLAVDGKTIRDRLGLVVTLVDTETGAPVAVSADVRGKGHELKLTQQLLASDAVQLRGAVVTADSLHFQDQTAHSITRERGGDYIRQVRENQPTLEKHAREQLGEASPLFLPRTAGMDESTSGRSSGS